MRKLLVKLLDSRAKAPTVAHPGEDLGFDVYALEDTFLEPNKPTIVKTGIAAIYVEVPSCIADHGYTDLPGIGPSGGWYNNSKKFGLKVEDRSSMAAKNGIETMAGIIDAGYRGELGIVMSLTGPAQHMHPDELNPLLNHFLERSPTIAARTARLNPATGWTKEFLATLSPSDLELVQQWRANVFVGYQIKAGEKIAQVLPLEVLTSDVSVVEELPGAARGDRGFGSTGK